MRMDEPYEIASRYEDYQDSRNLIAFIYGETKLNESDLEAKCVAYGLHTSAWEYMWEALEDVLGVLEIALYSTKFSYHEEVIRLESNWAWFPNITCTLVLNGGSWSVYWKTTISAIMMSLDLNPIRINHFIKQCDRLIQYATKKGPRPDMKFPYTRNTIEAYNEIAAPVLMKRLSE